MTTLRGVITTLALVSLAAPAANAQSLLESLPRPHVAIGGVASDLGLGGEVLVGLGQFVAVRGERLAGSVGRQRTIQSMTYDVFAKADNRMLAVDVHPFGGGLMLSAGKVVNHSRVSMTGQPTNGTYTVNGQVYPAAPGDSITGALTFQENPSYFGIGWDHTFGKDYPTAMILRAGVLHQERVKLALTAYGNCANGTYDVPGQPTCMQQVASEQQKEEDALDTKYVRNLPVLDFGIRLRLF